MSCSDSDAQKFLIPYFLFSMASGAWVDGPHLRNFSMHAAAPGPCPFRNIQETQPAFRQAHPWGNNTYETKAASEASKAGNICKSSEDECM